MLMKGIAHTFLKKNKITIDSVKNNCAHNKYRIHYANGPVNKHKGTRAKKKTRMHVMLHEIEMSKCKSCHNDFGNISSYFHR